jgi:peptidoglycan/LPS O-acetylase OafA/YrhL
VASSPSGGSWGSRAVPTWLIVALTVAGVILALLALCMVPDGLYGDGGCAVRLAAAAVLLFGAAVIITGCR